MVTVDGPEGGSSEPDSSENMRSSSMQDGGAIG